MKLKSFFLILTALIIAGPVSADEVDEANVTSFTDGTPAVADEVNANFQALIDAINDNASRIAALEADGGGNSVSGATFRLNQIGNIISAIQDTQGVVTILSQSYELTFNSDGSLTLSGNEYEADLEVLTASLGQTGGSPVEESGTWSQSGSTITTNLGANFTVSADGNVIVLVEYKEDVDSGGNRSETSFVLGIRTN